MYFLAISIKAIFIAMMYGAFEAWWLAQIESYYIYKIIVVCPPVHYGRSVEMIWPRDVRDRSSGHWALETRTRWSLWTAVMALATGTNTSFLDRLYKKQATMYTLTCSGLHIVSHRHGGSRFCLWHLAITCLAGEMVSSWLIRSHARTRCSKCACASLLQCNIM